MIADIHTHILPFVDDGAANIKESLQILHSLTQQGVTDIILTPHYIPNKYFKTAEEIKESFHILQEEVKKENIKVNLFLGQEIHYHTHMIQNLKNNKFLTLNNTPYILVEFSYFTEPNLDEILYEADINNYHIIFAHIERYTYLDKVEKIAELKNKSALIQVNTSAIINKKTRKKIFKLMKLNLIDFIASDSHFRRMGNIQEAYQLVAKKFGTEYANKIFYENAKKLLIN